VSQTPRVGSTWMRKGGTPGQYTVLHVKNGIVTCRLVIHGVKLRSSMGLNKFHASMESINFDNNSSK